MKRAALLLWFAACASNSGRTLADPSSQNMSAPHPQGEPTYVNAGGDGAAAAIMTAVGVGAAAAQRKAGGCYANCPPGTTCNHVTGFCDEIPCRGLCTEAQFCDTSGPLPRCVAGTPGDLKVNSTAPPPR